MLVKITGIKVHTTSLQNMNWKRLLFFNFHEIGMYCCEKNTIPSHVHTDVTDVPMMERNLSSNGLKQIGGLKINITNSKFLSYRQFICLMQS